MSSALAQQGAAPMLPLPPINERDYYTHQEAKHQLGIQGSKSLSQFVQQGQLHRVYLPTVRSAAYLKSEVAALAAARRLASFSQSLVPVGLLTRKQACAVLGRATGGFIFHHEQCGHLHPVHLPGRKLVYYHREEVEALAQARAEAAQQPQPAEDYAEAYAALYAHMFPRLTSYLRRRYAMTHEAAEDLVQGTFMIIWQRSGEFFRQYPTFVEQCPGVIGWVRCDLRHEMRRQHAIAHMVQRVEQVWRASRLPTVEEMVIAREQICAWWQRCQTLLSPVQQAIVLWYAHGYSYTEITARLHAIGITWTERSIQNYGAEARLQVLKASHDA